MSEACGNLKTNGVVIGRVEFRSVDQKLDQNQTSGSKISAPVFESQAVPHGRHRDGGLVPPIEYLTPPSDPHTLVHSF